MSFAISSKILPLVDAVKSGFFKEVKRSLLYNPFTQEDLDEAFILAASGGKVWSLHAMIQLGDSDREISDKAFFQGFYWAAAKGHYNAMRVLFKSEQISRVNIRQFDLALEVARKGGRGRVIQLMEKKRPSYVETFLKNLLPDWL